MSDPLLTLRDAVNAKSSITYTANADAVPSLRTATHIVLGSESFPKATPTRLRKPGTTSSDSNDFYTLEAVYLAWHLQSAGGAEYMKQARENGLTVGFVSVTERKGVVDWLEGHTDSHPSITPLPGETAAGADATGAAPSAPTADTSASLKRKYVPDIQDLEVVKKIRQNETELRDRNSVLRGHKLNNFSNVHTLYAEKLKKLKESSKSAQPTPQTAPTPDPKLMAKKAKNMYPIIMISSSPTALITMHNVRRFLQESTFEPSQDARNRAQAEGNARPDDMIPIYRKRTHIDPSGKETETSVRYVVVDSVEALSKLGQDAWDRVVCVMTTGQAWQFRPYKWNEPKQLFHHVKGFYVTWSNDPPNPKIKDWNVTELKIDPHRRHVDKSVVAHFWKTLDTWTAANKPSLMRG